MDKWRNLAIGGLMGVAARYLFAGWVYKATGTDFPYGTMAVNLSGCLLVGFFNSLAEVKFLLSPNDRILLMTGFCGAYTTFSTLMLETSNLINDGEMLRAAANFFGSGLLGFLLFRLGACLGTAI
ncbi:MAG TPA: fluoride efflux transporter CrcB [Elusimicrobia bacterium]|nr:fluoride efflux transporter CrcB [Elusimicrobiota bacterium]HBT62785.1 fluoride efflux transporter CrcB [Elusimicrobiota bacterium]